MKTTLTILLLAIAATHYAQTTSTGSVKKITHNGTEYTYVGGLDNNNKCSGLGKYYDKYGKLIYDGEWLNDVPNGKGTYYLSNGDMYVGEHVNGKFHGQGVYTFSDGRKYVGQYKDDKMNGYGTYYMENMKYEGNFKANNYHGRGTLTNRYNISFQGNWSMDKLYGKSVNYFNEITSKNSFFLKVLSSVTPFNYAENRFTFQLLTEDHANILYEELDYTKLNFSNGEYVDIPFVIRKNLLLNTDFIFVLINQITPWSILDANKESIVKSFNRLTDENEKAIGVFQRNVNLSKPINKPGTYYIRLYKPSDDLINHLSLFAVGEFPNGN